MVDEIKLVPYMLGKLLGGTLAVIGLGATLILLCGSWIQWEGQPPSPLYGVPLGVLGGIGVFIFLKFDRTIRRRAPSDSEPRSASRHLTKKELLYWAIFAVAGAVICVGYLLIVYHS